MGAKMELRIVPKMVSRWTRARLCTTAHSSANATELARSLPVMCNFYVERLRKEARSF